MYSLTYVSVSPSLSVLELHVGHHFYVFTFSSSLCLRDSGGKVPIVGSGGIRSGQDAYDKIRAGMCSHVSADCASCFVLSTLQFNQIQSTRTGASLLEIYTSMIYGGPRVIPSIKSDLSALLRRDGFDNIQQAVGVDAKKHMHAAAAASTSS